MADGGQTGPSVWTVADGRAGILNQAKALASALAEPERAAQLSHIRSDAHRPDPVILQPRGWQLMLRPDLWPSPVSALPDDQRRLLPPPWPDVWIAAGRRSIPYSRMVWRHSGGRTLVIQTQNPRVDLGAFDLVIPPEHDGLAGANVFPILGSPTWFPRERIDAARQRFAHLAAEPGQKVLVSLGGDSKTHRFTEANASQIEAALVRIAAGRRLWISVSRRTPEHARVRFRRLAGALDARFWENEERDGPNPYLAWLTLCDVALVTAESANLITDPAFFGKPVYLLKLDGGSRRFNRLHHGFIQRGAARWFVGGLDSWTYPPFREAARAADEIVRRLLLKHPEPA